MKTLIKKITPIVIICSLITSCIDEKKESVQIMTELSEENDTLLINSNIYSGFIHHKDSDKIAALWIHPDTSFFLMCRNIGSNDLINSINGKIEIINGNQIAIPIYDTVLIYNYSESELLPLKQDFNNFNNEITNKYKMSKKSGITDIVWKVVSINGENINYYNKENTPYIIFSNDSLEIYGNCGCNPFVGKAKFRNNNEIDIFMTEVQDEICLPDALEREFIYMLNISDNYTCTNNTLTFYHRNNPVGYFYADYLFYE